MTCAKPGSRVAVTGATGFVGQSLVEHLAAIGYEVVGISERPDPPARIKHLLSEYHCVDLARTWPTTAPLDALVHLAGLAAVGPSFEQPQEYISINSSIVTNAFEYALETSWGGRALVVSSGAVYGATGNGDGFTEDSPLTATSPYVVSKLLVELQADYYRKRGIDILVARPFNHIGPGQRSGFVVPDLVEKVRRWRSGSRLAVGNLDSLRDYTDVRDIVRAYSVLLSHVSPRHTTYNVASGVAISGWTVLEQICAALGVAVPPTEVTDRRVLDPSVVVGDANRLRAETGWEPTIKLQNSIEDFVGSS